MSDSTYLRAQNYYRRRAARFFFKRPLAIKTEVPLISFTFDDFPRSALLTGGAILRQFGLSGTYYAAFGLMGKHAPVGQVFLSSDLDSLVAEGHELGCHTFDHCDSGKTSPVLFDESISRNREALRKLRPGMDFKTFSYPISEPRALTKQRTARRFDCSRGGGQIFNSGTADLNYLSAYFLEKSRDRPAAVREMVDRNREARGWLILATHDVCESPSPFGCTPDFFADIVRYAVNSGARILPVTQALEALRRSS